MQRNTVIAWSIFLVVAALLLAIHGQRMVLTNDEGIVLDAAQRMTQGQRPYIDFFTYMSPGSYWLQATAFRWFGLALWTGRLIVILDFALQCALVFWLVARLSSRGAGIAAVLAFAGFQIADPGLLTAQHRWDSATLALAGVCAAVAANGLKERRSIIGAWLASGGLLAAAAWCTPSTLLAGGGVAGWLVISSQRRRNLIPFAGGVTAVTLAAFAALASTGSLLAFFNRMFALPQGYSALNNMPYGAIIGGYRALFEGANTFLDIAVRGLLVTCVALPAILPVAAVGLWGVLLWRNKIPTEQRPVIGLLLVAQILFVATTWPRPDVMHLAFIAALPYALGAGALARVLPSRAGAALAMVSTLLATVFTWNYVNGWNQTVPVPSPVGILRVPADQASAVGRLLATVHAGDSLFVYPYMPIQYFLTQGKNPTQFFALGPGSTSSESETESLVELEARPPEWMLYMQLSREEFLRIFPNGTNLGYRLERLEAWIERNYLPVEGPSVNVGGYRLLRLAPAAESASLR